jgi:hypothetical protein
VPRNAERQAQHATLRQERPVNPVTSGRRDDGRSPRRRRQVVAPPGSPSTEEDWRDANQAKAEKLRHKKLRRLAGARGLELRHSAYGYALIDSARQRIENRSDMTLDEIESCLERT